MGEDNVIKFAIVGCGHIGKRHATMVTRNEEAELVGLVDNVPKDSLALDDFQGVPFYSDIEDLLAAGIEIDVVCICTPNGLHSAQATKAIESGHHVVCEKPMGLSKDNCEKVLYTALQNSKQVFCVMQNRYSPPSIWIKDVIESKLLGEVFMVQLNCYWNRDDRYYSKSDWKGTKDLDGGTLFTQFSHFIDIMYWLFGDIQNIQGKFADFTHKESTDFEDSGFVNFDFVEGG